MYLPASRPADAEICALLRRAAILAARRNNWYWYAKLFARLVMEERKSTPKGYTEAYVTQAQDQPHL